jgi:hypothetical protein
MDPGVVPERKKENSMKTMRWGAAVSAAAFLAASAGAANIYVLSSGDAATDSAVMTALTSRGHTATLGVTYDHFDGTQSLSGFQTVYLQANFNWTSGLMPAAGQQQLINYVTGGGRLVTCEWVTYYTYSGGNFEMLGPILPLEQSSSYVNNTSATYDLATPDPTINAGVSAPLTFAVTSYAGTETLTSTKSGATAYYTSQSGAGAVGLAGWAQGSGSVFSFSTTCGPNQLADANFGRLFSNVMSATGTHVCYANCDNSTAAPILNIADFVCFQQKFAAGDPYANCDGSTAPPVLNIADFVCFQQHFAAGCP